MKQLEDRFSPSNTPVFIAQCMGACVCPFLDQMELANVIGGTRAGVFLQDPIGQVVFLSGEIFRGPITINLEFLFNFKRLFAVGESCSWINDRLVFQNCQIFIPGITPIWTPPSIQFEESQLPWSVQRGIDLTGQVVERYKDGLFYPFMDKIARESAGLDRGVLWGLIPGMKGKSGFLDQLPKLIGLGSGLTPAGDDFLCGFLLARFYLDQAFSPSKDQNLFHERITALAQTKTTALSAALINCAARGEADERVLNALRWITQGEEIGDLDKASQDLQSYGSSSGIDALAGILAAIITQQPG